MYCQALMVATRLLLDPVEHLDSLPSCCAMLRGRRFAAYSAAAAPSWPSNTPKKPQVSLPMRANAISQAARSSICALQQQFIMHPSSAHRTLLARQEGLRYAYCGAPALAHGKADMLAGCRCAAIDFSLQRAQQPRDNCHSTSQSNAQKEPPVDKHRRAIAKATMREVTCDC